MTLSEEWFDRYVRDHGHDPGDASRRLGCYRRGLRDQTGPPEGGARAGGRPGYGTLAWASVVLPRCYT